MAIFFYIIFCRLYRTGILFLSPWNRKAKLWLLGRKNIFERVEALNLDKQVPLVWMHCASIGEFEQGRPVLEKIRAQYPRFKIMITFFSSTGYELKKNYEGADYIFYLPADSQKNARLFISAIEPKLVLWIKHEYWFFYLAELRKRNIPTLLISASFRPGQPFFRWYGQIYRAMLQCFTHIFVQSEESRKWVDFLGLSGKTSISGDTRFDRVIEIAEKREIIEGIDQFCGLHPVIVAGSTWEEDEEELSHYANSHSEIRFLIAPCSIEEENLQDAEKLFRRSVRYSILKQNIDNQSSVKIVDKPSEGKGSIDPGENSGLGASGKKPLVVPETPPNVLLIDSMGILSALYRYGHIAYVGGGFGDAGVHNVLEAAVYGRPVVIGPVIEKYAEAVELVELGGAIVIASALEAEDAFNRLFENPEEYLSSCEASKNYVYSKRGASTMIIQFIQEKRLLTN